MNQLQRKLPWLSPGDDFPSAESAWASTDPAPGLLAAGGTLDIQTLVSAYAKGTFPWFSDGQPILWWNPDPRMVLRTADFKLHRSLRKKLGLFLGQPNFQLKIDSDFEQVIRACASKPRQGQSGTWIVDAMVDAYIKLHATGYAHSVETWLDGKLIGGLYCVNLGQMVFGESMFSHQTDASKIALAALVSFCRINGIGMIDCQQKTGHLASLGAAEISRAAFIDYVDQHILRPQPHWHFDALYWNQILSSSTQRKLP